MLGRLSRLSCCAGCVEHLAKFDVAMLRWCSLHTLNLGPMVWASAAALILLAEWAAGLYIAGYFKLLMCQCPLHIPLLRATLKYQAKEVFGQGSFSNQLKNAYVDFRQWAHERQIVYLGSLIPGSL